MARWIFAIVLLLGASAKGQTFYAPVQYQYQAGNGTIFYYGGTAARVFEAAERGACLDPTPRVYGDCRGWLGYENPALTADDARNQAYASVPRYFRMSEQRAIVMPDGSGVVPIRPASGAGTIEIKPYVRRAKMMPMPVLIIPREMLVPSTSSDKSVARG